MLDFENIEIAFRKQIRLNRLISHYVPDERVIFLFPFTIGMHWCLLIICRQNAYFICDNNTHIEKKEIARDSILTTINKIYTGENVAPVTQIGNIYFDDKCDKNYVVLFTSMAYFHSNSFETTAMNMQNIIEYVIRDPDQIYDTILRNYETVYRRCLTSLVGKDLTSWHTYDYENHFDNLYPPLQNILPVKVIEISDSDSEEDIGMDVGCRWCSSKDVKFAERQNPTHLYCNSKCQKKFYSVKMKK
jgi:hypothetical protein